MEGEQLSRLVADVLQHGAEAWPMDLQHLQALLPQVSLAATFDELVQYGGRVDAGAVEPGVVAAVDVWVQGCPRLP